MKLGKDGWPTDDEVIAQRDKELAAAKERIAELETMMLRWQKEYYGKGGLFDNLHATIDAERAVSDKLANVLKTILSNVVLGHRWHNMVETALTEVEAMRKEQE